MLAAIFPANLFFPFLPRHFADHVHEMKARTARPNAAIKDSRQQSSGQFAFTNSQFKGGFSPTISGGNVMIRSGPPFQIAFLEQPRIQHHPERSRDQYRTDEQLARPSTIPRPSRVSFILRQALFRTLLGPSQEPLAKLIFAGNAISCNTSLDRSEFSIRRLP
jgi:hypothetical protein